MALATEVPVATQTDEEDENVLADEVVTPEVPTPTFPIDLASNYEVHLEKNETENAEIIEEMEELFSLGYQLEATMEIRINKKKEAQILHGPHEHVVSAGEIAKKAKSLKMENNFGNTKEQNEKALAKELVALLGGARITGI